MGRQLTPNIIFNKNFHKAESVVYDFPERTARTLNAHAFSPDYAERCSFYKNCGQRQHELRRHYIFVMTVFMIWLI